MTKSWIVSAALLAMIAGPAFAADMPVKAPPAPAPVSSWTGVYLGGEVGAEWNRDDWQTNCIQAGGAATCGTALNAIFFPGAPDATAFNRFSSNDARGGIYAGWMFQINQQWVAGFEADYAWHDHSQTVAGILGCSTLACAGLPPPLNLTGDSTTLKIGNDWSFRLRAGYLLTPDLLLYGTGGLASQRVQATVTCNGLISPACINAPPANIVSQTSSDWLVGYTVGAGIEWKAWSNLLLRAEYRFNDYGSLHQRFVNDPGLIEEFANVHDRSQMVTFGIAYLFNPWAPYAH